MASFEIALELKKLDNQLRRAMDIKTGARDQGITPEQLMVIRYVSQRENEPVFQRDLEARFRVSRATVSSTLTVMEKKGLIRRESVPEDARLKRIVLAPQADLLHENAKAAIAEINSALSEALTDEEQKTLNALFLKLEDALQRQTEDRK